MSNQGTFLLQLGRYKDAVELILGDEYNLKDRVELFGDKNKDLRFLLAKSYYNLNQYKDSIFWLESVVSSTNQSVVAGDVSNPPFLVEAVKLLHDSYLKTNDYKSALSLAQNVAVSLPESALGHTWMGDALLDLDRPSEAIVFYKIAVHVDEEECFAWMGLGKAYLSVEDVQSAAYCLKKAISLLQTKPQNSALVSKNLPVLTFEYGKVLLKIAENIPLVDKPFQQLSGSGPSSIATIASSSSAVTASSGSLSTNVGGGDDEATAAEVRNETLYEAYVNLIYAAKTCEECDIVWSYVGEQPSLILDLTGTNI